MSFVVANFFPGVRSNGDAEQILSDAPVKAYIAWRVPFENDQYRISYVTEEGPFAAPRRVVRTIDVSYVPDNGCYVILSQLNPTPYSCLLELIEQRAYIDTSIIVPGGTPRNEPEKTAAMLQMDGTDVVEKARRRQTSSSAALAGSASRSSSGPSKLFKTLRKIIPKPMDNLVFLWDRVPSKFLFAVGGVLIAVQVALLLWAFSMNAETLAAKESLEKTSRVGLNKIVSSFYTMTSSKCEHGAPEWRAAVANLHDKLEGDFNASPAAEGIKRVSVAVLASIACLCVMSWIGFPWTRAQALEEAEAEDEALVASKLASQSKPGSLVDVSGDSTHSAPRTRLRGKRDPASMRRGLWIHAGKVWAAILGLSALVGALSFALACRYYTLPERLSQQFEDTFNDLNLERYHNYPQCHDTITTAIELYQHSPHIVTLILAPEVEGGSCKFGGKPVPKLSKWEVELHGDLPLFHCNSLIMPSTVGYARLLLLVLGVAIAGVITTLFVRDLISDVSIVDERKSKKD